MTVGIGMEIFAFAKRSNNLQKIIVSKSLVILKGGISFAI